MERVVITGMGAITPVGNDVPSFWESLKTGKCGIGPITKFDVSDHGNPCPQLDHEFSGRVHRIQSLCRIISGRMYPFGGHL